MGKTASAFSAHGFRATASTILNEVGYRREVIERQLAHAERNKVRASYNQAEYLQERQARMQHRADLIGELARGSSRIVPIQQSEDRFLQFVSGMPTKKKEKNSAPLEEPILRPSAFGVFLMDCAYSHSRAAQAAIHRHASEYVSLQKAAKLLLLAEKYGVDVSDVSIGVQIPWLKLCLCLAEEYVKGFKVVDTVPRGKGAPRKHYFELVKGR